MSVPFEILLRLLLLGGRQEFVFLPDPHLFDTEWEMRCNCGPGLQTWCFQSAVASIYSIPHPFPAFKWFYTMHYEL